MEQYFATMSEDIRHERSLLLLLSLTNPDIIQQSKLTDHETNTIKKVCSRKITLIYNDKIISCTTIIGIKFSLF